MQEQKKIKKIISIKKETCKNKIIKALELSEKNNLKLKLTKEKNK